MDKDYRNQLKAAEINFFKDELKICASKITNIIACSYGITLSERNLRNWIHPNKSIQKSQYENLRLFLQKYFEKHPENVDNFFEYVISKGRQKEYKKLSILLRKPHSQILYEKNMLFAEKLDYLEKICISAPEKILPSLNLSQLIESFLNLTKKYLDFFEPISLKSVNTDNSFEWLSMASDKKHTNYIVLSFCAQYKVLLWINEQFSIGPNIITTFESSVKAFMSKHKIDMILMFTDQEDISLGAQELLMERCNLFCEIITKEELLNTSLKEITYQELKEDFLPIEKFFAQIMFNRLTAYFPVIHNEFLFGQIDTKKLTYQSNSFTEWYDETILKELYNYRYMTRHAIYFERSRVKSALYQLQKKRKIKNSSISNKNALEKIDQNYLINHKLDLVVEICAPNTFTSCEIINYTNSLKLFSTSAKATKYLNNQKKPGNIEFKLGHVNPEIISRHYGHELVGKCDMIILGLGMGSMIENLNDYLRHINSWLKQDGVIVVSFVNTNSVLLNSNISYKLENMPIHFANYWEYQTRSSHRFLNRVQTYKLSEAIEMLKKIEIDYEINHTTYPYFMGLTQDVKDDRTRTDIRRFDKQNASKNMNGHYITLTGFKSCTLSTRENIKKIFNTTINSVFKEKNINYHIINHPESIDSVSLKNNLIELKIDFNSRTGNLLLKTVILKEKTINEKNTDSYYSKNESDHYIYCILPASKKVSYNSKKYHPVSQKQIITQYGQGTLSPAIVFPENSSTLFEHTKNSLCIIDIKSAYQENVIFTSGKNNLSFQITKSNFLKLMDSAVRSKMFSLIDKDDLLN